MTLIPLICKWLKQNYYFGLGIGGIYFVTRNGPMSKSSRMILKGYGGVAIVYSDFESRWQETFMLLNQNDGRVLRIESPFFFDELREHIERYKREIGRRSDIQ